MQCPLCNNVMVKNVEHNFKNNHNSLKCPHCAFVIFYRGINGLDANI